MTQLSELIPSIFVVLHWSILIGLSLRIIARRLPVGVSLAWLMIIFSVPFFGAAFYLLLSGKRLGHKRRTRYAGAQAISERHLKGLQEEWGEAVSSDARAGQPLYLQALGLMEVPAMRGNHLQLLQRPEAFFAALIADIDGATTRCDLAFYIWYDGGQADAVLQAILRASDRGVLCRVLVDAVGSKKFLRGKNARRLRKSGVKLVAALPRSLQRRADLRYHRKIVVIDNAIGYTGSQNLVDPACFKQGKGVGEWVDAVMRIEGPSVACMASVFGVDWSVESGDEFDKFSTLAAVPPAGPEGYTLLQVVASGPAAFPGAIHSLLLTAIYSAEASLTLTTPYFVPDEALVAALISAAQRGVKVTLVVPDKNDSRLVQLASRSHFEELLAAGITIALFQGGLLHTKSLVIDNEVSLFGSVNFDMRSFWLNFEISLFVYSAEVSAELAALQQQYLSDCRLLDLADWQQRSATQKFLQDAVRLISPLL